MYLRVNSLEINVTANEISSYLWLTCDESYRPILSQVARCDSYNHTVSPASCIT